MTSAVFAFPTTIVFGAGRISALPEQLSALGCKRPLIVTDTGLVMTGTFHRCIASAPAEHAVFSGVHSNPVEQDVEAATRAFIENGCDSVVGFGGGSAIDVGKILRLCVKDRDWHLDDQAPNPAVGIGPLPPLIAIPTTAGTGSEVGRSSVITVGAEKRVIFHPELLANRVILDPGLTVDLPARLTAATGADALTHCIESFTAPAFHPMCDGIALEGIRLITEALPHAVMNPGDIEARGKMLVAAMMGGVAFQKDLGAAHALAHPLSSLCGLHHGLANAMVLPIVMAFNAYRKPGIYERVGQAMGLDDPSDAQTVLAVSTLLERIGLKRGLRQHGVSESQIPALSEQAYRDSCHQTNPVPVTRQDLAQLYRDAM